MPRAKALGNNGFNHLCRVYNVLYIYTVTCIYWKDGRQHLEVKHQGVGAGGGCAPSCTECEAESNSSLKMSKTPKIDSIF